MNTLSLGIDTKVPREACGMGSCELTAPPKNQTLGLCLCHTALTSDGQSRGPLLHFSCKACWEPVYFLAPPWSGRDLQCSKMLGGCKYDKHPLQTGSAKVTVLLVYLGCYDRLCGLNNRHLLSHSSGDQKSKTEILAGLNSGSSLSLACRQQPSHGVLPGLVLCECARESELWGFCLFLSGHLSYWIRAARLWFHLTLITLLF